LLLRYLILCLPEPALDGLHVAVLLLGEGKKTMFHFGAHFEVDLQTLLRVKVQAVVAGELYLLE